MTRGRGGRRPVVTSVLLPLAALADLADALAGGHLAAGLAGVVVPAALAFTTGRWGAPRLTVGAALLTVGLLMASDQLADPRAFSPVNDVFFYGIVVGAPAVAGWLIGERSRQGQELRRRTEDLERRRPAVLRAARAAEAARVQQEVDRVLAGRVDRVRAGVRAMATSVDRAGLAEVEGVARAALGELREVLGVLGDRPAATVSPVLAAAAPESGRRPADRFDCLLLLACLPVAVEGIARQPVRAAALVPAALALGLSLVLSRRAPVLGSITVLVVAAAVTHWLDPLPAQLSWLLVALVAALLVGTAHRRSRAVLGFGVLVGAAVFVEVATDPADRSWTPLWSGIGLAALAWWAGRTVIARERRTRRLAQLAADLTAAEQSESAAVIAEERAAFARELHDVGAHTLTVVCLQAGAAARWLDRRPERADEAIGVLIELCDGPLAGLSGSLRGLVDSVWERDVLDPNALAALADLGRALGLDVSVTVDGPARVVPPAVGHTAFRVVQESLTNAARHAPRGRVFVGIAYHEDGVEVRVQDTGAPDGAGSSTAGAGKGLAGMRSRVEACRGVLDAGPHLDGFLVHARLPAAP